MSFLHLLETVQYLNVFSDFKQRCYTAKLTFLVLKKHWKHDLLCAFYFLSIALGAGHKIVLIISTLFSRFFITFLVLKKHWNHDLLCAFYFLSIALGAGHKIVLIISTLFSRSFYFHISIFSFCYSGPTESVDKERFRIWKILLLHFIKNLFQNWNVPKTCYCSTGNFLSSRFSPYL